MKRIMSLLLAALLLTLWICPVSQAQAVAMAVADSAPIQPV